MNTQETRKYFHVCLKNRNFVVIYKVQFTELQFLIRAINKPNLVLFETLIAKYMCVYEGTLIIQLPRLNWQTKLLQRRNWVVNCTATISDSIKLCISFDMYAWSKVISI